MRRIGRLATIALFAAAGVVGLYGVLLVFGVGGENGHRADYVTFGGRWLSTSVAGGIALAVAAVLVALAAALRRRLG